MCECLLEAGCWYRDSQCMITPNERLPVSTWIRTPSFRCYGNVNSASKVQIFTLCSKHTRQATDNGPNFGKQKLGRSWGTKPTAVASLRPWAGLSSNKQRPLPSSRRAFKICGTLSSRGHNFIAISVCLHCQSKTRSTVYQRQGCLALFDWRTRTMSVPHRTVQK